MAQPRILLCISVVVVVAVGCVEEAAEPRDCAPGQYVMSEAAGTGDRVCAPCGAGEYSAAVNAPSCTPCPAEAYNAAMNGRSCSPWTECVRGEYVASEGDPVTDRTCTACPSGTYSDESNAVACSRWTECTPGEYVVSEGDAVADRGCATCLAGTYSETMNAPSCTPWTECVPGEEVEEIPGTSTSDRTCTVVGWARQFGSSGEDIANAVAVDGSGNVVVAGFASEMLPGQTWSGGRDAFVRKYDAAGNELWTRQFGSSYDDGIRGVAVDGSGNVVVVGHTSRALPGQTSMGSEDAFVRMYDGAGTELWTRQFGERFVDQARGVSVDASGNVLVVGYTSGTSALPGQTYAGGRDAFVRKYEAAGTELWTRQFGSSEHDVAFAAALHGDGELVVVGYTGGVLPDQTSVGRDDAFVRSYDAAGTELWTRQFGSTTDDLARAVWVDGTGSVVVAGHTLGTLPGHTNAGGYDAFVRIYDAAGGELWTHQFGTMPHEDDYARAVSVDGSGNVVVAGYTVGTLPGQTSAGREDAFVLKLAP